MTPRAALRLVVAIGTGVGAVACLIAGQSWLYEHVERSATRALCDGECVVDNDPTSALFAFPLAVLACVIIAVLLLVVGLRSRPAGRLLRVGLFVAVVVAAASSVVVVHRTDWLRGVDDSGVCFAYPDGRDTTEPINSAECAPEHEPASGAWLLAAGVFFAIGAGAAPGPTRPAARVSGQPAVER